MRKICLFLVLFFGTYFSSFCQVSMYETEMTIPTYALGEPDPNPIFYTPNNYQGAQNRVYPYPLLNKITDKKTDKKYKALVLENEYIKLVVLPEIGGRIYIAYDKTNDYNFFYYNQVIKPSLIGMNGAWVSGGVEWNIPHHHRVSTFMPVDFKLVANADSSKTIWVGEFEKRHGMKWSVGLTVEPAKSYIKTHIQLFNVTSFIQSLLIWVNPAVHVNEDYQVIFPPDCNRAVFHAKVEFSDWPVSKQIYQGIDFTKGVDVSYWKNTSAPTSFFCWGSKMDFNAGIDHRKKAGTVLIADHYTCPGKKMWNWGNNDISLLWDKILTDKDGPYIELMMGAYSDNQPDYSWIDPYDTKEAEMFYYPVKNLSSIKNADKDLALNTELLDGKLKIEVNATSKFNIDMSVSVFEKEIKKLNFLIDPKTPYTTEIPMDKNTKYEDIKVQLFDKGGKELISFQQPQINNLPPPEVYTDPKDPKEIASVDELYITGLRLEQFHNAKFKPLSYYEEAYKRDSNHILNNTQLGVYWLKQYNTIKAEKYLRAAYNTVTARFTKSKYSEPLYYLGVFLMKQQRYNEAYDILQQAAWSLEWTSSAYFLCAQIDSKKGQYEKALVNIKKSIAANNNNIEARNLESLLYLKTDNPSGLLKSITLGDNFDKLNFINSFIAFTPSNLKIQNSEIALINLLRDEVDNYLETSYRLSQAGFYDWAINLLSIATKSNSTKLNSNPMIYYYLAYNYSLNNDITNAKNMMAKATNLSIKNCFPYGYSSIEVLNKAIELNPKDAIALYLLGNTYCDFQPELALEYWLKASNINTKSAVLHRNIAFVYANHKNDISKAIGYIDKAWLLDANDPIIFNEADAYYGISKASNEKRLKLFADNKKTILMSDVTTSKYISLLILNGKYDEAIDILQKRHFHAYESIHGNIHISWTDAFVLRGIDFLKQKKYKDAISDFEQALIFPDNLEIAQDAKAEIALYYLGLAYKMSGNKEKATEYFKKSAEFVQKGKWAGDLLAEVLYAKYLACKEIGNDGKANEWKIKMTEIANKKHEIKSHFTVSAEKLWSHENEKANQEYLKALLEKVQGNKSEADLHLIKAKQINPALISLRYQFFE